MNAKIHGWRVVWSKGVPRLAWGIKRIKPGCKQKQQTFLFLGGEKRLAPEDWRLFSTPQKAIEAEIRQVCSETGGSVFIAPQLEVWEGVQMVIALRRLARKLQEKGVFDRDAGGLGVTAAR